MNARLPTAARLAGRLLLRDWRAGELNVLTGALLVAVAAMTGVAYLTDRVGQAVEARAAESLAADLRLSSARPLPDEYIRLAAAHGLRTARVTNLPSVVFAGEASTLAAVRAVTPGYPLRGRLKIADSLLEEGRQTPAIPPSGEAWASPRLMARLGVDAGTEVEVGDIRLRLSRVLVSRPDAGWRFVDLAPTLLINAADLGATGLVQPGSRVSHYLLLAGSRSAVSRFKPELKARLEPGETLSDISETGPQIRSSVERSGRFLNLAALIAVLLAAIAVAMAARRYSHRHRDRVALMKCMGASRALIFRSNTLQLALLALGGGLAGALLGYAAQAGLAFLMRDMIGQSLPAPGASPLLLGLVTSGSILAGFALPDLAQMGKTAPLRVLRQDVAPPPLRYGVSWLAGVAVILALLWWVVRDPRLMGMLGGGMAAAFMALAAAGWLLVKTLRGLRSGGGAAWRYGLASVARRGRESVVQIVAFGLGLTVLLLLSVVRGDLMETWRQTVPDTAPNRFLINIQPAEVNAVREFLAAHGVGQPNLAPLVRARLIRINGEDITQMVFEDPQGERWARRDANLSWAASLQPDNRIVAGRFRSGEPGDPEVSVEQDFARELGLALGDVLTFDVAGETVAATVTSFRTVEWDSFRPNFFMLFSPGALESYPATWIGSFYVEPGQQRVTLDLMHQFPSITAIDLDAVLTQVREVMDKAALAVQAVFLFTLAAGLTVLWAAVAATRDDRRYESALLRTLGASRKRVLTGVAVEFGAIGLLAGLLSSAAAATAGFFLATRLFDLHYRFEPLLWVIGPAAGMALVGLGGIAATWQVITQSPMRVLRAA